ncbi:unnamed protein product [Onchocerca flexuosa]|uniref:SWIB domain-containing protein n=1 Tax=Onchocerca flexuosa TaxID=387005 RepID=A0A183GZ99_9BILA|nr:unnamed protein product [Onchocerca flexuosa]
MAEIANFELNRRSQVLHYRDGKINPPFLRKFWKLASQMIFNDRKACLIFIIVTFYKYN